MAIDAIDTMPILCSDLMAIDAIDAMPILCSDFMAIDAIDAIPILCCNLMATDTIDTTDTILILCCNLMAIAYLHWSFMNMDLAFTTLLNCVDGFVQREDIALVFWCLIINSQAKENFL